MIRYTPQTIETMRKDRALRNKLRDTLGVSDRQLANCINFNSKRLTELDAVNVIVEHTNQPLSELIEGGKVSKLVTK